jgi:hypothetical protein
MVGDAERMAVMGRSHASSLLDLQGAVQRAIVIDEAQ